MSKKGENIYKRKDGRWEGRYIRLYDENGKAKYGYVYGKNYSDVKQRLLEKKAYSGSQADMASKCSALYSEVLDAWLQSTRINIKESTYARYSHLIDTHIRSQLGNYSDCTLRVYIDCAKNQNSNVVATILNGRSILSEYYQEFDWGQVLTDEAVGLVKQVPVVGNYVSSIYDLGTQAEAIGVISSGLDGIKSADLDDISNISKKTEKRIDAGISIVNKGLGIYTKYKATEINNQNVQKNQEELEKLSKPLMQKTNLGLVYDTMVVKYDHCTYDDSGKGIKVDGGKDCDKSTCVISPSNYKFDPNVLRKQYDSIMHTTIANEEFAELEKQVKEYITTGNIEEKSILANYVKEWKE